MSTVLQYSNEIKQRYERARYEIYADFLDHPSNGKLLELCLIKYDEGLNEHDKQIFAIYFKVAPELLTRRVIERCDSNKFRTIQYFLTGRNKSTSRPNLNLIAVLIDFDRRPYTTYIKPARTIDPVKVIPVPIDAENKHETPPDDVHGQPVSDDFATGSAASSFYSDKYSNRFLFFKKIKSHKVIFFIAALVLTLLTVVALSLKSEPQCMKWEADHYTLVDCKVDSLTDGSTIEPYDKKKAALRLISVDSNTICFRQQKPQLWYIKSDGNISFFNQPGKHPVIGKPLRPISRHICEKYILGITKE